MGVLAGQRGSSADPMRVDPTGTTTQPVSGTVTAQDGGGSLTIDGTVTANGQRTSTAPTLSNVASSASNVTLLAANANAIGRSCFNDSTQYLYLKCGATASTTSFTVKIPPAGFYEFPAPLYTGVVDGIWDAANGNARLTEWT